MKATVCVAIGLLLVAAIPRVEGQNLIENGDFDTDVSGWRPLGTDLSIGWSPSDYADSPGSGSLLGTNASPAVANYDTDHCVDSISEGKHYTFSGWVKVPSGQTASGVTRLYWWWRSGPSCGGIQTLAQSTPYVSEADEWTTISPPSEAAPEGTMSAQIVLTTFKTSATPGTFQVFFDGLDFRVTGSIFIDGFESGGLVAWTNAVGE